LLFFVTAVQAYNCLQTFNGVNYDLTPLQKSVDYHLPKGSPDYSGKPLQWDIYMNVCGPLATSYSANCNNGAGCQQWGSSAASTASIGSANTATFQAAKTPGDHGRGITVEFTDGTIDTITGNPRKMEIDFSCKVGSGDGLPQFVNEDPKLHYNFLWVTEYACGPLPSGSATVISVGSILLIIFFCLLVLYVVVGLLVNKFYFKKEGLDIIPQKDFWFALPFLVKDGVMFIVHKIKGLRGGGGSTPAFEKL